MVAALKDISMILAPNRSVIRNGTIADGVSKLILAAVPHDSKLQFSIKGVKNSRDLTDGTLSPFGEPASRKALSVAIANPQKINKQVAVVYTPPDSFNQPTGNHRTIKILISDVKNGSSSTKEKEVSVELYRPPVILVHGLWTNPDETWVKSSIPETNNSFTKKMEQAGFNVKCSNYSTTRPKSEQLAQTAPFLFNVYCADYGTHNAMTFDPYANKTNNGNYGIQSINRTVAGSRLTITITDQLAATQVDVVGHSTGGLLARGYAQQHDYKNENNFMKGYIHRLITIVTPHFGGQLAGILFSNRENWSLLRSQFKNDISPSWMPV